MAKFTRGLGLLVANSILPYNAVSSILGSVQSHNWVPDYKSSSCQCHSLVCCHTCWSCGLKQLPLSYLLSKLLIFYFSMKSSICISEAPSLQQYFFIKASFMYNYLNGSLLENSSSVFFEGRMSPVLILFSHSDYRQLTLKG